MARKHRKRTVRKRAHTAGAPPGSAIYTGEAREGSARVRVLRYDEHSWTLEEDVAPTACGRFAGTDQVVWLDLVGVHDVPAVQAVAEALSLHPLAMEDVVHVDTRPKAEDYGNVVFIAAKMAIPGEAIDTPIERVEAVSIVLGKQLVATFQETEGDVFDPLRRRIEHGVGRVRRMGAAYLAHAVLDAIVDSYFVVMERFEERVAHLEERVFVDELRDLPEQVHQIKVDLLAFRRIVWPLREAVAELQRLGPEVVPIDTRPFFRDLLDHTHQVVDLIDGARDRLAALVELHLALTGHKTNEVMRVLTVVATLFIPLTFVVGVYGMNFDEMPELHYAWGYPAVWTLMVAMTVGMLMWFRRRGWL